MRTSTRKRCRLTLNLSTCRRNVRQPRLLKTRSPKVWPRRNASRWLTMGSHQNFLQPSRRAKYLVHYSPRVVISRPRAVCCVVLLVKLGNLRNGKQLTAKRRLASHCEPPATLSSKLCRGSRTLNRAYHQTLIQVFSIANNDPRMCATAFFDTQTPVLVGCLKIADSEMKSASILRGSEAALDAHASSRNVVVGHDLQAAYQC